MDAKSKVFVVTEKDAAVSTQKKWGVFHEGCFNRAIATPSSVMVEIRKAAEKI